MSWASDHSDVALRIEAHPGETLVHRLNNHLVDLAFMFEPPLMRGLETQQVLAQDLLMCQGGCAYLSQRAVQADIDHGRLFLVQETPKISRFAYAVYSPQSQCLACIQLALSGLRVQFR